MLKEKEANAKFINSRRVYGILSREGRDELHRPLGALFWSGVVAGMCIAFSLIAESILTHYLPDFKGRFLVANFGYCIGFTIVILGRFQLFTENTISAVLPLLDYKNMKTFYMTIRLWLAVFIANLAGTFCVATLIVFTNILQSDVAATVTEVSHHAVDRAALDVFIQAIPAGFLVAAITWLLPNAQNSKFQVLFMMTYLIAIGDFAHVIVGSCEVFVLLLQSQLTYSAGLTYIGMATLGNIIGGTGLFTVMAYAQVRQEIEDEDDEKQRDFKRLYNVAKSTNT